MHDRPTWTYELQAALRERITRLSYLDDPERQIDHVQPLKCQLRGPYGSTFTKCFNPKYTGCVVIGAGTGLTAALSVLREVIFRKQQGDRVPLYVWFVWSCRRVDDLLWCWSILHELLMQSIADRVIKPGVRWSEESNMMDWLGLTIYVSQADRRILDEFIASTAASSVKLRNRYTSGASQVDVRVEVEDTTSKPSSAVSRPQAQSNVADEQVEAVELATLRQRAVTKGSTSTNHRDTRDSDQKQASSLQLPDPDVGGFHRRNVSQAALVAQEVKSAALAQEVHQWMAHKNRLLSASLDDPEVHIAKLLAWARVYIDRKVGHHKKMAICFCGPSGLAHTIGDAARELGAGLEFSADHQ